MTVVGQKFVRDPRLPKNSNRLKHVSASVGAMVNYDPLPDEVIMEQGKLQEPAPFYIPIPVDTGFPGARPVIEPDYQLCARLNKSRPPQRMVHAVPYGTYGVFEQPNSIYNLSYTIDPQGIELIRRQMEDLKSQRRRKIIMETTTLPEFNVAALRKKLSPLPTGSSRDRPEASQNLQALQMRMTGPNSQNLQHTSIAPSNTHTTRKNSSRPVRPVRPSSAPPVPPVDPILTPDLNQTFPESTTTSKPLRNSRLSRQLKQSVKQLYDKEMKALRRENRQLTKQEQSKVDVPLASFEMSNNTPPLEKLRIIHDEMEIWQAEMELSRMENMLSRMK